MDFEIMKRQAEHRIHAFLHGIDVPDNELNRIAEAIASRKLHEYNIGLSSPTISFSEEERRILEEIRYNNINETIPYYEENECIERYDTPKKGFIDYLRDDEENRTKFSYLCSHCAYEHDPCHYECRACHCTENWIPYEGDCQSCFHNEFNQKPLIIMGNSLDGYQFIGYCKECLEMGR